ncbi:DNA ligase (ATP) [Acididesulfobacillus acetoxydans]|uniref:DNA ligase (ATP) n=1 Tax=Acididesulfobacillus acetoxydans TaxID=1561005 RepID=A0A8S0WQE3_9FIRM|nr:hypothetical protein [Acididesulfobacillus acetoxydans]CAA7602564.1 DNA ligase (ATP) [Acididesulfobacillus acetoxydans]CEJ07290.1 ATP-dependent DNA ligase [Acididesulfobacillus acetoxydans]
MAKDVFRTVQFPLQPMEPQSVPSLPVGNYLYQVKWDGFRWLAYHGPEGIVFQTKSGRSGQAWFPELPAGLGWLKPGSIIDGEVVCLQGGKPDFPSLLKRVRSGLGQFPQTSGQTVEYVIFDLLFWQGEDLRARSLQERLEFLTEIALPGPHTQVIESFSDGNKLWSATGEMGLEGIVAKEYSSPYRPGKDRAWQKIKHWQKGEFLVGGIKLKGETIKAVCLGRPVGEDFVYVCSVSGGLERLQESLGRERVEQVKVSPFTGEGPGRERDTEMIWLRPEWRVKVRFLEWTPGGKLRHAQIEP